jgi:hypothetical protein
VVDLTPPSVDPNSPLRSVKLVAPVTSSVNPTLHLQSEPKVIDPIPSSVSPTLHLKSVKIVNLVPSPVSSIDQKVNLVSSSIEPQTQLVDPVLSSINPTLHQKSETKVVNLVASFIEPVDKVVDPTLP